MKKIAEQADRLVGEIQKIADNLWEYNTGLCKRKTPLDVIQYDCACLARELAGLHGEIGGKIINEKD